MGAFLSYYFGLDQLAKDVTDDVNEDGYGAFTDKFCYAVFDPTQHDKPADRTKDIIAIKHRHSPRTMDRAVFTGCDTLWKCFKKTVWCHPQKPFLGVREEIQEGLAKTGSMAVRHGEYNWKTFEEVDEYVEALSRSIIHRKFCPYLKSGVEGTPDMKFLGIFSENRLEWIMTEIACCSDSITVVPLAVENQFMNEERIQNIINITELSVICVSKATIGVLLDMKSKDLIPKLKNIILFDTPEDAHIALASQVGFNVFSFADLITEGYKIMDCRKDEPTSESILLLGVTSGTTGEPKLAMLSHMNVISG